MIILSVLINSAVFLLARRKNRLYALQRPPVFEGGYKNPLVASIPGPNARMQFCLTNMRQIGSKKSGLFSSNLHLPDSLTLQLGYNGSFAGYSGKA